MQSKLWSVRRLGVPVTGFGAWGSLKLEPVAPSEAGWFQAGHLPALCSRATAGPGRGAPRPLHAALCARASLQVRPGRSARPWRGAGGPGRAGPCPSPRGRARSGAPGRAGAGGRAAGRGRRRSSPGEGGPGLGAGGGRAGGLCARRRPRAVADLEGFTPALPPSAPRAPARLPARACALSARTPLIFSSRRELTRSPCLAAGAQGAAAAWLMRCLLGRWCFTPLRLLVRRWLISESSCCPALVWTLRAWWSSLVVSVPGWRGGVIIGLCETRALRFGAVCQRSKQHGIFPRSHGSKGVPC